MGKRVKQEEVEKGEILTDVSTDLSDLRFL